MRLPDGNSRLESMEAYKHIYIYLCLPDVNPAGVHGGARAAAAEQQVYLRIWHGHGGDSVSSRRVYSAYVSFE